MTNRIGLFTNAPGKVKKGAPTTTASYVEVAAIDDLTQKLAALGAKRVGLLLRDRAGTTHLEGAMFSVGDLKHEHKTWLTANGDAFQTRGLFFAKE
jgi:hypothetical protein